MEKMKNKLFTIILTALVTLSMTVPAFVEAAYADDSQDQVVQNEQTGEETGAVIEEDPSTENAEGEGILSEEQTGGLLQAATTGTGTVGVTVKKNPIGTVELSWDAFDGASYYNVYSPQYKNGAIQKVSSGETLSRLYIDLAADTMYTFTVDAYRNKTTGESADKLIARGSAEFRTYKVTFDESLYRTIGSKTAPARDIGVNLRTMIGEGNGGYAVAQGSATDGKYAYHMLASSSNQKGRVVKTELNGKLVKAGGVINIHHANGMTYDSKRNLLVCIGYGSYRHQLSYINPDTLELVKQTDVKYNYNDKMSGVSSNAKNNGLAAIAYVEKYDVYVCRSRGKSVDSADSGSNNDILVFDAETLEKIGHIFTKVTGSYPETYQSMDADEKYVYYLLSPGSGQSRNIILCLDWNSEELLPVVNGDKKYVEKKWYCNNDNSGRPDAVITIPFSKESEGLFHTTDKATGKQNFYVTEYRGIWTYKTKTVTEKYKVKWKKVRKKVKWKRVYKKGKWRWKYKKKKVWKYKTKTRKVKKQVKDTYTRNDYVYDLGVI